VISRETSFVAVERREMPVEGDMQLRRVPIALPVGWGGLDRLPARMVAFEARASMVDTSDLADTLLAPQETMARRDFTAVRARALSASQSAGSAIGRGFERLFRGRTTPPAPTDTRADPIRESMLRLIRLQHSAGSWALTEELAVAIGRELEDLESEVAAGRGGSDDDIRLLWATALALAWLEQRANHLKPEWEMLAKKGRHWLETKAVPPIDGPEWIQRARRCLEA